MGLLFSDLSDCYDIEEVKLGEGSFGQVWRAIDKRNSEIVAIKQLVKKRPDKRQPDYRYEVDIMQRVLHEHILKFIGMWEDATDIYLVLEYCDGGDFSHKLKFRPEQPMGPCEPVVAEWLFQVCSAIGALHAAFIVHRDVNPKNFMLSRGVLKLADFGIALLLPREDAMLFKRSGTPGFMAPEQCMLPEGEGYSRPVDMWAAGIVLHMMLHGGRNPCIENGKLDISRFERTVVKRLSVPKAWNAKTLHCTVEPPEVQIATSDGEVSARRRPRKNSWGTKTSQGASPEAQELLERLLTSGQRKRATAEEALKHPWLACRETVSPCGTESASFSGFDRQLSY